MPLFKFSSTKPNFLLVSLFVLSLFVLILTWPVIRPRRIFVIKLTGRLGNQLFQLAAGLDLQSRHPASSLTFLRNNYSSETDLSSTAFVNYAHFHNISMACPHTIHSYNAFHISEKRFSCDEHVLQIPSSARCIFMTGLFQCAGRARAGLHTVRRLLQANVKDRKAAREIWHRLKRGVGVTDGRTETAIVHVRRGDYTKRFNRGLLEPLPREYYSRAVRRLPRQVGVIAVFSDDVKWARREIVPVVRDSVDDDVKVQMVEGLQGAVRTLLTMSMADHFVIANSSFSWWAAFIGGAKNKVVVAPMKWFGDRVRGGVDLRLFPPEWIIV